MNDKEKSQLTEEQKTEYFRRSYAAVDGLWFMKVEQALGFDQALKLDEAVWRVLPKIQARTLKGMMNLKGGLPDLNKALAVRLELEGFSFEIEDRKDGFAVIVSRCPWHEIMVRSGRESLSDKVSDLICRVENSTWAGEFDADAEKGTERGIKFEREQRICRNEGRCVLRFWR
ncbi:MAG TPA: DUF6125 family protein [Methanothrix sp.]|nr:DUF6125 family protein [Methanothrix sp.]